MSSCCKGVKNPLYTVKIVHLFLVADTEITPTFQSTRCNTAENSTSVETGSDIYRTGAKCVEGGIQDRLGDGTEYHSIGAFR